MATTSQAPPTSTDVDAQAPTDVDCCPTQVTDRVVGADEAAALAGRFKALADPVRLQLVSIIASAPAGEVCACDLPAVVERSQSTVSHHLSILVAAGILAREQRGRWAWFTVDHDVLGQLATAIAPAG